MKAISKTAGSVASEVLFSRQNFSGSFFIVEGPSDYRFWMARKEDNCEIILGLGSTNVIGALPLIDDQGLTGVCGLIDDDFFSLIGHPVSTSTNLIRTDPRDLEGLLLRSSAIAKVLAEYGDKKAIDSFLEIEPPSILDAILKRALVFGQIHWVNQLLPHPVCLDALKPQRWCNRANWTYDEEAIKKEAISLGVALDINELNGMIRALPTAHILSVCRGHDLVDILCGGLLGRIGNGTVTPKSLESVLRSGIERQELEVSTVIRDIRTWEATSGGYKLISTPAPREEQPADLV